MSKGKQIRYGHGKRDPLKPPNKGIAKARKLERAKRAAIRAEARAKLSNEGQLRVLDTRPGNSDRERERLGA